MLKYYKNRVENLINISRIVTIHYMECQKDFYTLGERHNFWEILYVDKGRLDVETDEGKILLHEGDIIFHSPNEFHAVAADGVHAPNLFIISFDCNSEAMSALYRKHYKLKERLKVCITNILREANDTFKLSHFNPDLKRLELKANPNLGGQQMIRTYLEQFIILLLREENTESKSSAFFQSNEEIANEVVASINSILQTHLDQPLTIDKIREKLGYGKTYLSTVFKKHTGQTIIKRFQDIKIQKAKLLLRERNYNCAQISEQLGFDTPSYFTKCFKEHTGMTPLQYAASTRPLTTEYKDS